MMGFGDVRALSDMLSNAAKLHVKNPSYPFSFAQVQKLVKKIQFSPSSISDEQLYKLTVKSSMRTTLEIVHLEYKL
jgi:hypothetical protein